jgi:hypothetical protein
LPLLPLKFALLAPSSLPLPSPTRPLGLLLLLLEGLYDEEEDDDEDDDEE